VLLTYVLHLFRINCYSRETHEHIRMWRFGVAVMLQPRSAKLLYGEFRRCWDGQRSRYVIDHPTQLSLAIPSWVGA